jgi:hypothetical protein
MWTFAWDDNSWDTVGLGGFLFILERLEGDTTHAVAMLDLPYIQEMGPGQYDMGGDYDYRLEDGRFVLDLLPFEFVETIDGMFRYTVIPYDRLHNMGDSEGPNEFASEWSWGDKYGTYPFINLYDNRMYEEQNLGDVNNNTYATVTFDIFGMGDAYDVDDNADGYRLRFELNGTELVEGTDFRLIARLGNLYYLVLLEPVRNAMQEDTSGDLLIDAYIMDGSLEVQFTVDLFNYKFDNLRTGFGFGRFRPGLHY